MGTAQARAMSPSMVSVIFLFVFWSLFFVTMYIWGMSGSPQPENWQTLLHISNATLVVGLLSLLGALATAIVALARGKNWPLVTFFASFVGIVLLLVVAKHFD